MLDGTHFFECSCGGGEHTLKFVLCKDEDDPCIYADVFLDQYNPCWKRVWLAIKYIFGYKTRYGHFGCWEMKDYDAKRLRAMCDEFLKDIGG